MNENAVWYYPEPSEAAKRGSEGAGRVLEGRAKVGLAAGRSVSVQRPALKLVKMRRLHALGSPRGTASGGVMRFWSAAEQEDRLVLGDVLLHELQRRRVRVGVEHLVGQRRGHLGAQDVVDEQVRVVRTCVASFGIAIESKNSVAPPFGNQRLDRRRPLRLASSARARAMLMSPE